MASAESSAKYRASHPEKVRECPKILSSAIEYLSA